MIVAKPLVPGAGTATAGTIAVPELAAVGGAMDVGFAGIVLGATRFRIGATTTDFLEFVARCTGEGATNSVAGVVGAAGTISSGATDTICGELNFGAAGATAV